MLFGLLHPLCRFRVAAPGGDALQGGEPVAQVLARVGQRQQGFQPSLAAAVIASLAAFGIAFDVGVRARAMVVQIRVEVLGIETVDGLSLVRVDVGVAQVLADHAAILGFH